MNNKDCLWIFNVAWSAQQVSKFKDNRFNLIILAKTIARCLYCSINASQLWKVTQSVLQDFWSASLGVTGFKQLSRRNNGNVFVSDLEGLRKFFYLFFLAQKLNPSIWYSMVVKRNFCDHQVHSFMTLSEDRMKDVMLFFHCQSANGCELFSNLRTAVVSVEKEFSSSISPTAFAVYSYLSVVLFSVSSLFAFMQIYIFYMRFILTRQSETQTNRHSFFFRVRKRRKTISFLCGAQL